MTEWLGVSSPEMLALWFGADDTRTPSGKSVSSIMTDAGGAADNPDKTATSASVFLDTSYPRIIDDWAKRMGYDLSLPSGRRLAILARLPFTGMQHGKARAFRVSPRDFSFLRPDADASDAAADSDADASDPRSDGESSSMEADDLGLPHLAANNDEQTGVEIETGRNTEKQLHVDSPG